MQRCSGLVCPSYLNLEGLFPVTPPKGTRLHSASPCLGRGCILSICLRFGASLEAIIREILRGWQNREPLDTPPHSTNDHTCKDAISQAEGWSLSLPLAEVSIFNFNFWIFGLACYCFGFFISIRQGADSVTQPPEIWFVSWYKKSLLGNDKTEN